MGKKSGPTPPPAPDPTVVANAQSAANTASAAAQQKMNMVGTSGPTGTTGWSTDASQPGGYSQYTHLSQPEQATYDLSKTAQNGALGVAGQQIGRVGDALGQPLTTDGLPALTGNINAGQVQSSFDKGQGLQYGFNPGQQVQGHVGPQDLYGAAQQAQNAVYGQATSRLDPQWDLRQHQMEDSLANQGLSMNSDAWKNAQTQFGRDRNDAYNQANYSAVGAGNDTANQLFNQSVTQGTFANSAAGQQYAQNQGQAAFHNQASGQDFGQNQSAASFANNAQNQQFNQGSTNAQLSNTARNQGLQERAYTENQPINQFNALMSSGQVGMPQGVSYTPSQVANTDVTGAYALSQQAQQANYQAQMQNQQSQMGGLFNLGAAALMAPMTGGTSLAGAAGSMLMKSDVRLKNDLKRVGALDDGTPVYSYRYKEGGPATIGVLAHELRRSRPELVYDIGGGFLAVDYGRL